MSELVTAIHDDGVAILRLDDGKANALSPDMLGAIGRALDAAEKEGLAVCLEGRPGRFSAGFDLGVMREGGPGAARAMVRGGALLALRLARFPAPVVVACTGHALAMGAVLLTAADSRIGARGDFKLGFNEVAIGMATPVFLVELARERLSRRHFLRATVQAEIYDPESALDCGLLDRTVEPESVAPVAVEEARRLGRLPRAAYCRTRRVVREAALERIEATLDADLGGAFPG